MIQRDYLIIGAGLGGASVCQALREYDSKGSVTLVGNESSLPYHRSRLLGSILAADPPRPEALSHLDRGWYEEHNVELRLETLVTQLNLERRLAVLKTGQVIEFRKACLATGARPIRPPVAGATLGNVVYLRTVHDLLALREIAAHEKSAAVIGGGLVAAEAAAALSGLGINVRILCRHPCLWQQSVDAETARWLTELFACHGVPLQQETLNGFEGKTVLRNIQTKSGNRIAAGVAVVAAGTEPNLGLVANTPLGSPGGTPVNEYLETDEKGIYAVGDIALYPDPVFGGVRRTGHWETTLEQGRIAGGNITAKKRQKFKALPAHATTLFGLRFEFIGDFRQPPARFEIDGSREKRKFTARYYQGAKLMGVLLCNEPDETAQAAREQLLQAHK